METTSEKVRRYERTPNPKYTNMICYLEKTTLCIFMSAGFCFSHTVFSNIL